MRSGDYLFSVNQRIPSASTGWASGLSGRTSAANFKSCTSGPLKRCNLSSQRNGVARELCRLRAIQRGVGLREERDRVTYTEDEQTIVGAERQPGRSNSSPGSERTTAQPLNGASFAQKRGKEGRPTRPSSFEEDAEALELVASGFLSQANPLGGRATQRANGSGPSQYLEDPSTSSREAPNFWDTEDVNPERQDWSDWHRRSSGRQAGPRSPAEDISNQRKPAAPRKTIRGTTSTDQVLNV